MSFWNFWIFNVSCIAGLASLDIPCLIRLFQVVEPASQVTVVTSSPPTIRAIIRLAVSVTGT